MWEKIQPYIQFPDSRYIYLLIGLILQVHKREKWETIPVTKHPDHPTWTYRRTACQNWVWKIYGNDCDGVTPFFHERQWGFYEWFLRNFRHNYSWFWGGLFGGFAWWEEGDPYSSLNPQHLEVKWIVGDPRDPLDFRQKGFVIWLIKPSKRPFLRYRPYFRYNSARFRAWWGWGDRGMRHCSIELGLKS